VALERGDERTAYVEARRALAIDPENPMASHLSMRMAELLRARGEQPPADAPPIDARQPGERAPARRTGLVARLFRRRSSSDR
ncbi:MAG TPA: hypothetical protein VIK65_13040, partial [Candidatus Limnocylindrales bacterium]